MLYEGEEREREGETPSSSLLSFREGRRKEEEEERMPYPISQISHHTLSSSPCLHKTLKPNKLAKKRKYYLLATFFADFFSYCAVVL